MLGSPAAIQVDTIKGILIFRIGGKLFGMDLEFFSAFVNPKDDYGGGLAVFEKEKAVKYKGEFAQLINLAGSYGLKCDTGGEYAQIIFIEWCGRKFAFFTDSIEEIISFDRYLRDSVRIIEPEENEPALGLMAFDDKTIIIPDFEAILNGNGKE